MFRANWPRRNIATNLLHWLIPLFISQILKAWYNHLSCPNVGKWTTHWVSIQWSLYYETLVKHRRFSCFQRFVAIIYALKFPSGIGYQPTVYTDNKPINSFLIELYLDYLNYISQPNRISVIKKYYASSLQTIMLWKLIATTLLHESTKKAVVTPSLRANRFPGASSKRLPIRQENPGSWGKQPGFAAVEGRKFRIPNGG